MCMPQNPPRKQMFGRNPPELIMMQSFPPMVIPPQAKLEESIPQAARRQKWIKILILTLITVFVALAVAVGIWLDSRSTQWPIVDSPTCWNNTVQAVHDVQLHNRVSIIAVGIRCKSPAEKNDVFAQPKEVEIIGYDNKFEDGYSLGKYGFDRDLNFKRIKLPHTSSLAFNRVGVRFLSNWGDPNVTCVESVIVYGRVLQD